LAVIVFGVWQSLQPPILTRYLPRSAGLGCGLACAVVDVAGDSGAGGEHAPPNAAQTTAATKTILRLMGPPEPRL
jgi:hypothetical protein